MATNFYYVYALKDPRTSPAMPLYVGNGWTIIERRVIERRVDSL
jgi:hypothetical protein